MKNSEVANEWFQFGKTDDLAIFHKTFKIYTR
jgi:hypothetical protein